MHRVADPGLVYLPVIPANAGIRVAGGRPAAGYFLLRGQERSNQREGRPWFTATVVVSLCYSTGQAAVELARKMREHIERARAQTVLAEFPGLSVLLGGAQGVPMAHADAMRVMVN